MQMTYPYRLSSSTLKALIGSAAPFVFALMPVIRKKMGWKVFSLPGMALLGGLWLLEKRLKKTSYNQ